MEDLALSSSFWRDKRVFITGHTGFKGAWLSIWLQRLGASVAGYALPAATVPNLFELAGVANSIRSEIGDVRDLDHLNRVVAGFRPHIIMHLAAQSLVRPSYAEPVETFGTNVMGTVNILEAARQNNVRAIVNVTTDKCYENVERQNGYRENEPLGGHDPYSGSKAGSEIVTSSYRRSFSLGVASARAGNVIGGGDWAEDRLLPDMMRAFLANEVVAIRNPASTRPWQHVLEPLFGYLLLAERLYENTPQYAEAWNFGPDDSDARPVEWLADRVCDLWGPPARWSNAADGDQPHEARFLRLNCDKAKSRLGWRPRMGLEQALVWTVQWYKGFQQGDDMRTLTEKQITKYETGKDLA